MNIYKLLCRFTLLACMLSCTGGLQAQSYTQFGTGTAYADYVQIFGIYGWSKRHQTLIKASEMTAAGFSAGTAISSVGFNVIGPGGVPCTRDNWMVKVFTSTASNPLANGWVTSNLVATSLPASISLSVGWHHTQLASAYVWNGTDDIIIETCFSNGAPIENATIQITDNMPANTTWTISKESNTVAGVCGDNTGYYGQYYAHRPNIRLGWSVGTPCSGVPAPGNTLASAAEVCSGEIVWLSLQNQVAGTGVTYQWQSSSNGTSWTNVPGATISTFSIPLTASTYFRAEVTCGSNTAYSNSKFVPVIAPLAGGTYTINNTLPTGGTNFHSFTDLAYALRCAIGGAITVNVAPGTYNEQFALNEIAGTSATNKITINGNGATISHISFDPDDRGIISLNGTDHVTVNNLVINGYSTSASHYAWGVYMTNDADNNTIDGCTIILDSNIVNGNLNYVGIASNGVTSLFLTNSYCDNITIRNNTIIGGDAGVFSAGAVGAVMELLQDWVISNNEIRDFGTYGMFVVGSNGFRVDSNNIHRTTKTAVSNFNAIHFTGTTQNLKVRFNKIHDVGTLFPAATFGGNCITVFQSYTNSTIASDVSNNVMYNIQGKGDIYFLRNYHAGGTKYFHNTIVADGSAVDTGETYGLYVDGADDIDVANNNIYIARATTGIKVALYLDVDAGDVESDHNNIYMQAAPVSYVAYDGSDHHTTLAMWQAETGNDMHSYNMDPQMLNAASGDLTPSNVALDNKGIGVGIVTDINGAIRNPLTPDVGAVEFLTPACTGTLNGGVLTAGPGYAVCPGTAVSLALAGHSFATGISFQLEEALDVNGPWASVGTPQPVPVTSIVPGSTRYYRFAVACPSGTPVYSTAAQAFVAPPLAGGIYTINQATPTNISTGGSNFNSFTDFANAVNCSILGAVTVNVAPGVYNERLSLVEISGTSSSNKITINGNGATLVYTSADETDKAIVSLNGTDHIVVNNLHLQGYTSDTSKYAWGVHVTNGADSVVINGCTVTLDSNSASNHFVGIVVSGSSTSAIATGTALLMGSNSEYVTLTNNTIVGGYYGISMVGGLSTLYLKNCSVVGNEIRDFYKHGIYSTRTANAVMQDNNIHRATRSAAIDTFYGIYLVAYNYQINVSRNKVHDPSPLAPTALYNLYGIYIKDASATAGNPGVVANNVLYNMQGAGTHYYFYSNNVSNTGYYHNTIASQQTGVSGSNKTYGFYSLNLSSGTNFRNNNIVITRSTTGDKIGVYLSSGGVSAADYDNIYVAGNSNNYIGYRSSSLISSIATWNAGSGHSISVHPFFANAPGGNLEPSNIAMDNKGTPTTVTTDITGATRNATTPDIGAYEFPSSACTGTPVAGTASSQAASCATYLFPLTLTGFSAGSSITIQWQSSPTGQNTWTNITGATTSDYYHSATVSADYRAAVTCGSTAYSNTTTVLIEQPHVPVVTANGSTTICTVAGDVTLTAEPGVAYLWSNGQTTQDLFVATQGTYWVKVTTAVGCVNTSANIVVSPKVMPGIIKIKSVGSLNVCAPNTVQLMLDPATGSTTGFAHQWKKDGVAIPGATATSYTASVSGNYALTVAGGASCAKTSSIKVVTIKTPPTATFTVGGPTTFCGGGQVTFSAPIISGQSYTWLKNGNTNAGSGAVKSFNASGDYSVIATFNGCKDTSAPVTVTVSPAPPLPKIVSVNATTTCQGTPVQMVLDPTVSSVGASMQWAVGGVAISGATDSTYAANASGSYTLSFTSSSGCTKVSSPKVVVVKPMPVATFSASGPTQFCDGGQVTLAAPGIQGYTYTWLKDGTINAGSGTSKIFKVSGVYTVIALLNGCKDTADNVETITVYPLPVANIATVDPTTICNGDSVTLDATPTGAFSYEWKNGNSTAATTATSTYEAKTAGTYKVLVTDANGCVSKLPVAKVVVKVNQMPNASITVQGATTIPANGSTKLVASPSSGVTWQWYLNGNPITGATAKNYIVTVGGDYTLAVTKTGCTNMSAITTITQTSVKGTEGTTSVPATEELSFELVAYPNPVSGMLTVAVRGIEDVNAVMHVMDVNGRVVATKQMTTATTTLDMTSYANGIYLVRYKDGEGRTGTIRIVKQ